MNIGPTELAARAQISKGYASDILSGNEKPSAKTALRIFKTTGLRVGQIATLSDDEIAVLEKMHG